MPSTAVVFIVLDLDADLCLRIRGSSCDPAVCAAGNSRTAAVQGAKTLKAFGGSEYYIPCDRLGSRICSDIRKEFRIAPPCPRCMTYYSNPALSNLVASRLLGCQEERAEQGVRSVFFDIALCRALVVRCDPGPLWCTRIEVFAFDRLLARRVWRRTVIVLCSHFAVMRTTAVAGIANLCQLVLCASELVLCVSQFAA